MRKLCVIASFFVLFIAEHDVTNKFISDSFFFTANPAPGSESMQSYEITEGTFAVYYN